MSFSVPPGRPGDNSDALVAAGYDAVYAGASRSRVLPRIWREAASGVDYPAEFGSISFVTLAELNRLARETKAAYRRVLDAAETLSQEVGSAAIAALGSEMTLTLDVEPYRRRVLAVSTRV